MLSTEAATIERPLLFTLKLYLCACFRLLTMSHQHYPSTLLENAVNEFSKLPGIGRKTALRMALFMLRKSEAEAEKFGNAIISLRKKILHCRECHNISDTDICQICAHPGRDKSTVCVVENIRDVMSIENTQQYKGLYHVLGGIISPMDGIGPADLEIESLMKRVEHGDVSEVILALSTTMEGDTTNFYIFRKLSAFDVKITTIARGIAIGDELEYADEITLGRSITNRVEFSNTFK